jgi:hypothetical protein
MQKVTSIYFSRTSYKDQEDREVGVAVKLTIDYVSEEYSITPQFGKEFFLFNKATSNNWKMWKAVVQAIDNAIEFANEELGIGQEIKSSSSALNSMPMTSDGSFVKNVITDFID